MRWALDAVASHMRCVQALEAVEKAVACNPDNGEMKRKARDLRKLAGAGISRIKADKENQVSSNHADAQQPQTPSLEERPPLKVTAPCCCDAALSASLHMDMRWQAITSPATCRACTSPALQMY